MAKNISFVFALLALVSLAQIIEGAITKTPGRNGAKAKGSCIQANFDKVSRCCKTSPDDFVEPKILFGCSKMLKASNVAIMREYSTNKIQFDNKTIVLGGKRAPAKINTNSFCFAECAFTNLSLIVDGEVDFDAVTAYVQKRITNTHWQTILGEAVATCQTTIEAIFAEDETKKTVGMKGNAFKSCATTPGLIMQCLLSSAFQNCPEESKIATPACLLQEERFAKCGVFVEAAE